MYTNYVKIRIFTDRTIGAEEAEETTSSEFVTCVTDSTLWYSDWPD